MEEWKDYNIGQLCSSVCSGGTPSSKHSEYYDGNIPWLNTKEINFNRIYSTEKCITEDGLNNSSAKWIKENAVIVAMYGATAGKTAISKIPLTTNQACCNLTINSHIADYRFVYYHLCNKFVELASLANGGAQQNLNSQIIKEFPILLPSLSEQKAIANILSSLDDKIEVNRRINDNLEQQAQALFKSWFVDFEPFKNGEFVESELGMIPKGWRVGRLGEICAQSSIKVGIRNDVKVLSPVTTGKLILSEEFFTKQVFSENIAKYKVVRRGAFAYNPARVNIGSLGRNEYDFDGAVSPVYVVFECMKGYSNYFDLFRKTERFKTEVLLRAIGGVRQSLNYVDFAMIQTIIAPQNVVDTFNPLFERIKVIKKHLDTENDKLATLRDTLLPKLMTGELKVNEVEECI